MTDLDTTLRANVADTVDTYGKSLIFRNNAGTGAGSYNPDTGIGEEIPIGVAYTYKTSPPAAVVRRWGDMDTPVEGSVEVLLPAKDLDSTFESTYLRPEMTVEFDSKEFRAHTIEKIYSGDLVCAYRIVMSQHSGT